MKPLSILFSGLSESVRLIGGESLTVHVRRMPQRHLPRVLGLAEDQVALVEFCTYLPLAKDDTQDPQQPIGYKPVPAGWTDNLDPETDSFSRLHALADSLNFKRAAAWGQAQIAAKKQIAPLEAMALEQIQPLVEKLALKVMERAAASSTSTPKSPPSPATPGSSS